MNKKSGLVLLLIMGCCFSSVSSMEIGNKKSYIKIKNGFSKIEFGGIQKSVYDWVFDSLLYSSIQSFGPKFGSSYGDVESYNHSPFSLTYISAR